MTILAKLVASERDPLGYRTLVFECLDEEIRKESLYVMTVMFPNWEHRSLHLGEIGYLQFEERRAGIDKWWDKDKMVPYNYDITQFIKFVSKPEDNNNEYIM